MKKILVAAGALAFMSIGCNKFVDVNQDPNRPADVPEKLLLGPIQFNIAHNITAGSDNGVTWPTLTNYLMQTIALNQAIPNFGTYQITPSDANSSWSSIYSSLQNLSILMAKADANKNYNYSAISRILTAMVLGIATDAWGDIPYTEALKGTAQLTPKYDKQEDIYNSIQALLDQAISDIDQNAALKPGTEDFYYYSSTLRGSDMAKWKRLAYTLKARYYMHLIKAPGRTAAGQADLALAALQNGLSSSADDLRFPYQGTAGFESRWSLVMRPISTVIMAKTLVDTLVNRNDPRTPFLITMSTANPAYRGREIGYVGQLPALNTFSQLGAPYGAAGAVGHIFNYTEALFLKAEATLYKSGFAAAQPIFTDAVRASMAKFNISTTDVNTYLASRGTLTATNALQRIMEEKFIANYLSIENYTDWRRTGFPRITIPPNALLAAPPRRFLYPQSEMNTNPQPQHSAQLLDKVWWDN